LPAILVYATALTAGVLAAMATQIQLGQAGYDLSGLWRNLFAGGMELRTAGPWWAIAAAAFVIGGLTAAILSRVSPPWHRLRALRWTAGAALVFMLSAVGHRAAGASHGGPGEHAVMTLAALGMAIFMAFCGAYLTARK
jgi:hypothetical protein